MTKKINFKLTYGNTNDSIDELIETLYEDNFSGDNMPGIELIHTKFEIYFNDKKYSLCGYILWNFPNSFTRIKDQKNGVYLTASTQGDLNLEFLENNKVKLIFLLEKELKEEIIVEVEDLVKPIYRELYKFIEYFEENADERLIPNSFKYTKSLKKYLDENPINSYLKDE